MRESLPNGSSLVLWSLGDDWVSNQVFWHGWQAYEPEAMLLWYGLASQSRCTLDVGAHVGLFALIAAHAGPTAPVFAFEPHSLIFERLERHGKLNRLANLECVCSAVGSAQGQANFFFTLGDSLPSTSSLTDVHTLRSGETPSRIGRERVPITTLDGFLAGRGRPPVDLVKIDTEGTEPAVLEGMIETLELSHPDIICEVLPERGTAEPLRALLEPLGYKFYLLTSSGPEFRPDIVADPSWRNFLFSSRSKAQLDDVIRMARGGHQ